MGSSKSSMKKYQTSQKCKCFQELIRLKQETKTIIDRTGQTFQTTLLKWMNEYHFEYDRDCECQLSPILIQIETQYFLSFQNVFFDFSVISAQLINRSLEMNDSVANNLYINALKQLQDINAIVEIVQKPGKDTEQVYIELQQRHCQRLSFMQNMIDVWKGFSSSYNQSQQDINGIQSNLNYTNQVSSDYFENQSLQVSLQYYINSTDVSVKSEIDNRFYMK